MNKLTFNHGWYLVYTRPKREKNVAQLLSEKNIPNFLPTVKKNRQWNDRKKLIIEPLFPSYVFVQILNHKDFLAAQDTEGVVNYVRFGKVPAYVSEKVVNNIRLLVHACEEIDVSSGSFDKGQQLLIQDGPLTGLSCEMVTYKGGSKALVRVDLLQRTLLVNVPSSHLKIHFVGCNQTQQSAETVR